MHLLLVPKISLAQALTQFLFMNQAVLVFGHRMSSRGSSVQFANHTRICKQIFNGCPLFFFAVGAEQLLIECLYDWLINFWQLHQDLKTGGLQVLASAPRDIYKVALIARLKLQGWILIVTSVNLESSYRS